MTIRRRAAVCNPLTNDRAVVRDYPEEPPMSMKELKPLLDLCREQGFEVSDEDTSKHIRLLPPDKTKPPVFIPNQLRPGRDLQNVMAKLKRAGLVMPEVGKRDTGEFLGSATKADDGFRQGANEMLKDAMEFISTLPNGLEVVEVLTRPAPGADAHETRMTELVAEYLGFCIVGLSQVAHAVYAQAKIDHPDDKEAALLASAETVRLASELRKATTEVGLLAAERDKARGEKEEISKLLRDTRKTLKEAQDALNTERESHALLKSALSVFKQAL